jgi:hypothetical protein
MFLLKHQDYSFTFDSPYIIKMKQTLSNFLLSIILLVACTDSVQKIEITPEISISVPQRNELAVNDSVPFLKTWQTSFEDDNLAIFRYSINRNDTISTDSLRKAFRKNIDSFTDTFDLREIDSTFAETGNGFECNLNFDFMSNGEKYKFAGRFLADKQYFTAFCFQSPYPFDNYSKKLKDRILNSIEIK